MPERQFLEMLKNDLLLLGTYLQEKKKGTEDELGVQPIISEESAS
jgi:hypothetical protein